MQCSGVKTDWLASPKPNWKMRVDLAAGCRLIGFQEPGLLSVVATEARRRTPGRCDMFVLHRRMALP